jgi:hypothetical protein
MAVGSETGSAVGGAGTRTGAHAAINTVNNSAGMSFLDIVLYCRQLHQRVVKLFMNKAASS